MYLYTDCSSTSSVATSTRMVVVHERSEKVAAMFEGAMEAPAPWENAVEGFEDAWACMACCECEAAVSMLDAVNYGVR